MRVNINTVSQSLTFQDDVTQDTQMRLPVIDVIRGHLIAKDGIFATALATGGGVVGYARYSWAAIDKKVLKSAITAKGVESLACILPDRHGSAGLTDGLIFKLNEADAIALGCDLCQVTNPVTGETWMGVIALTATAALFTINGIYPQVIGVEHQSSTQALKATALAVGLEQLKAGSMQNVPATRNRVALNVPAFLEGEVIVPGSAPKAALIASNPYQDLVGAGAGVVTTPSTPVFNNRYSARTTRRRTGR